MHPCRASTGHSCRRVFTPLPLLDASCSGARLSLPDLCITAAAILTNSLQTQDPATANWSWDDDVTMQHALRFIKTQGPFDGIIAMCQVLSGCMPAASTMSCLILPRFLQGGMFAIALLIRQQLLGTPHEVRALWQSICDTQLWLASAELLAQVSCGRFAIMFAPPLMKALPSVVINNPLRLPSITMWGAKDPNDREVMPRQQRLRVCLRLGLQL